MATDMRDSMYVCLPEQMYACLPGRGVLPHGCFYWQTALLESVARDGQTIGVASDMILFMAIPASGAVAVHKSQPQHYHLLRSTLPPTTVTLNCYSLPKRGMSPSDVRLGSFTRGGDTQP